MELAIINGTYRDSSSKNSSRKYSSFIQRNFPQKMSIEGGNFIFEKKTWLAAIKAKLLKNSHFLPKPDNCMVINLESDTRTHPSIHCCWRREQKFRRHIASFFFCFSRPRVRTKTSDRKSNSPERPEFTSSNSEARKPWWSPTHPVSSSPTVTSANHHG